MNTILLGLLLLVPAPAQAASIAGVSFPDTATVGGQTLKLNGLGLREKYFIDVYAGALYLKSPTGDAAAAIAADEPKRIVMHFVYNSVPADKMRASFDEGFATVPGSSSMSDKIAQLNGWMADLSDGDQVVLDYVPGTGTAVKVKGQAKGTIAGADFMRALWTVYLGPKPPTAKLKKGMLGR